MWPMRRIGMIVCVVTGVCLAGCEDKPDAATLAAWRKEAQEANERMLAEASKKDAEPPWILHVEGQVEKPVDLSIDEVRSAGEIVSLHLPKSDIDVEHDYRGVKIDALIGRARPRADATSVTFVASDGYWAAIDLADVRTYGFFLAFEQNERPIAPAEGGPLKVAYDYHRLTPELQRRHQNANVLYVTHIVVGDEPAHVRVGSRVFDDAALDALPEVKLPDETVAWRTAWPGTPQTLWGVSLREVIRATGRTVTGTVRVLAKDALHKKSETVAALSAEDVERCGVVLVRRYGDARKPVPSGMGGPVLFVIGRTCRERFGRSAWMAFVESVELTP